MHKTAWVLHNIYIYHIYPEEDEELGSSTEVVSGDSWTDYELKWNRIDQ
jgi:hypothetical protein